ncbi:MAG: 30S ribosomal protein S20 [Rubrobacteraceae bacterium]
MPAPSKRDKQNAKRGVQNRGARTNLRTLSKNFYRAIDSGDVEGAREIRDQSQRAFSKAATKGVIHRNKASRKISRFDKALAGASQQS